MRIIYTRLDGGLSIVIPSPRHLGVLMNSGMTEEEAMEDIKIRVVPADAINARFADESEIPADRQFRGAWEDTGIIEENLGRAKAIYAMYINEEKEAGIAKHKRLENNARFAGNAAEAAQHAAMRGQFESVNSATVGNQIKAASTIAELKAINPLPE